MNTARPIRILHIFGCTNRGGAEMRTLDLLRCLPPGRFELEFCSLSGQPGHLDDEIRRLGGKVHGCKLKSPLFPWTFGRLLRQGRFDIVHSHIHYLSGFLLMLAHRVGVPGRIAHFRNTTDGKQQTLPRRLQNRVMKRWIERHASLILAVGRVTMESAWGVKWRLDSRCQVIPNGLNTAVFDVAEDSVGVRCEFGLPENCPLVLHVGRMSPSKNHVRLSAILGELMSTNTDAFALVVGKEDAAIKKAMVDSFQERGVLERVRFAGIRNDVPRLLLGSDLVIFPSLWEGLPGVVLEACAAGTPLLVSNIPATNEIAETFPNIHLLSLERSDREWARMAMDLLDRHPSAGERRASLDHFHGTVYDIGKCVAAYIQAWESCLSEGSQGSGLTQEGKRGPT